MIVLYFFGPLMEQWWGSRRFLAFYLLCGTSAAVIYSALVVGMPNVIFNVQALQAAGLSPLDMPLVGASGSIFGILVGAAMVFPHQRIMLLIPPIPMSMRTLALILLGLAVLSLVVGAGNAGGEAAHLGGAALGFVLVSARTGWIGQTAARSVDRWPSGKPAPTRADGRSSDRNRPTRTKRSIASSTRSKKDGLQSLTRNEKKILNRATERQRRTG